MSVALLTGPESSNDVVASSPLIVAVAVGMSCASVEEVDASTEPIALVVEDVVAGLSRDVDASVESTDDVITPERALVSKELVSIAASLARNAFDNSLCVTVEMSSAIAAETVCLDVEAAPERSGSSEVLLASTERSALTVEAVVSGTSNVSDISAAPNEAEAELV